jgi:UDP-4-amino-4,6-dideoxy-N-acetyl-beta-L-altrosamine N-acetyltransferase
MNIKLIDIQKDDIELIRNWRNSEDVSKYMYNDSIITQEQQENWFKYIQNSSTSKYWLIEYDNVKIGVVNLTGIDKTLQSCYWAFYLGEISSRGAGIGGEIEYTILDYVFNTLKLNKLRCEVFVSNEKVIKMHEKFGFRREAYYREHCLKGEQKLDVVGLAILRSEWEQIQPILKKKVYDPKNS